MNKRTLYVPLHQDDISAHRLNINIARSLIDEYNRHPPDIIVTNENLDILAHGVSVEPKDKVLSANPTVVN